jgi:hypothetical protein
MKIELAPNYRNWMLLLLPTTLGLGTAALWLISLGWPLSVDEEGLTLRDHRRVSWGSIRKIGVSRCYLDGHVSQIRIHHGTGVANIRIDRLQDGQDVARIILAMFEHVNQLRRAQRRRQERAYGEPGADRANRIAAAARSVLAEAESPSAPGDTWGRELAMLGKTLTAYPEKISDSVKFASEGI